MHLLESRGDLAVGAEVHLVLRSPTDELVGFQGRVIHLSPTGSASVEVDNPEGAPVDPALLAPPRPQGLLEPIDEGVDAPIDAASAATAEYDVDVGRLIGEETQTDPGTVLMEIDDDVEVLVGAGDDEAATVAVEAIAPALDAEPEEIPDEVEAAFAGDDDATRVEEEDATRVEEAVDLLGETGDEATRVDDTTRLDEPPIDMAGAIAKLASMNPVEKRRYALAADRLERALLMRDGVKQLQMFVLKNPRVGVDEIIEYSRQGNLTAEAVTVISSNPHWIRSQRVRSNLLRNPATPRGIAKRLLETLTIADLFILAKTGEVKFEVQQLARSVLERRGFTG